MNRSSLKMVTAVRVVVCGIACAAWFQVVGCGDDNNHNNVMTQTTVNVTLTEFVVSTSQGSAPAGRITFHVTNIGEDMHEFLVIKTDLAPDDLPTEANGSYEEDGPGTDLLDEIEVVNPGNSADLQIDLQQGKYVLICNMVHMEDNGDVEVHYQLGMHTGFVVN